MPACKLPTPTEARVVLAVFAAAVALLIGVSLSPLKSGFADAPDRGPGDVALYRAEVDRLRGGQQYHDAAAAELRLRGYPTRSVFNWRTPLPMAFVAAWPDQTASRALLGVGGLLMIVIGFSVLADDGGVRQGLLGAFLLSGAVLPCLLGDLVVMAELWSGMLIGLSAVCYASLRRQAGLAAALAALFFRELAAPYCAVCIAIALAEGRRRELLAWACGLAGYALFFGWHLAHVLPRIGPDDLAHGSGWIRFGGAGFLISITQLNAYLLLLPQWVSAVYLACVLLGAATWTSTSGRTIAWSVVAYVVAFALAGHDFNQYWGSMTAPLFCLAAARAPFELGRLALAARSSGSSLSLFSNG